MMMECPSCRRCGTPLTGDNLVNDSADRVRCRACNREKSQQYRARQEAARRLEQEAKAALRVPVAANHNVWDMYHPQCPEPDKPMPPLVLRGPFGGPDAAPWRG